MQNVILVDENDREIGLEEKLAVHQNGGKLHRAISILVFNDRGDALFQQRAMSKYHASGKWTNTCCSHPRSGEGIEDAMHRRLREELGFDCEMKEVFTILYRANVGNGMTEHEYCHVFFGRYNGEVTPNKDEVMAYKWEKLDAIRKEILMQPDKFTPWIKIGIDKAILCYNAEHKQAMKDKVRA